MARISTAKGSKVGTNTTKSSLHTRSQSRQRSKHSPLTAEYQDTQLLLQKPPTTNMNEVTQTSTSTPQINHEQSIHILQTLLHASLSSVLFQRSIFPTNCYETRYYVNNSDQWTYKDYLGANQGVIKGDGAGGPMLVLKKNVSGRVDCFLDLLENGIFDAMRRGFLRALRLSIYEHVERPNDVLESWTLTIHYADVATNGQRLAVGIDVTEQQSANITLNEAKLSLNDFIRKLTGMCVALPALPAEKNIILEIMYTDDRPEAYFAPGFPHPVYDIAKFPSNKQWEKTTSDVALMSTSYHAAALKVSHLRNLIPGSDNCLPSALPCTKDMAKVDEVMSDLGERAKSVLNTRSKPKQSKVDNYSISFISEDDEMQVDFHQLPDQVPSPLTPRPRPRLPGPARPRIRLSQAIEDLMEISDTDQVEQEEIRSMLRSAPSLSNNQATQPVPDPGQALSSEESMPKLVVSHVRIDQIDRDRDVTLPPRKEVSQIRTAYEHMDQITIRCTCEHQEEEGDMIECEFCETYQHIHCCGYLGKADTRIPVVHVCYECLLKDEEELLQKVQDQSVYRRALWLLRGNYYKDAKSLAQILHCTKGEVDQLIKQFSTQAILTRNSSSCKKGNPPVLLNNSAATQEMIRRLYFDPTFGITHHLEHNKTLKGNGEGSWTKSKKRALEEAHVVDEEVPPASKRVVFASGANFINGSEVNTPKTAKKR